MHDTTSVKVIYYVHQEWKLLFDALVGIGTILLAIVTVYGENLKRYFQKTKLKVDIKNSPPFIEEWKIKNEDGSLVEKVKVIRLCVENDSKRTAVNCIGVIHEYYSLIKNKTTYKRHRITPEKFKWDNGNETITINCEFPVYLQFAKICKPHVETLEYSEAVPENATAPQNNNKLFLFLKDRSEGEDDKNLGEGNFIIPIRILGENLTKSEVIYINLSFVIDENGSDNLTVELVEQAKFTIEK